MFYNNTESDTYNAMPACYIDRGLCTGARFSFCAECKKAQVVNAEAIAKAKTPVEITLAHCLDKT